MHANAKRNVHGVDDEHGGCAEPRDQRARDRGADHDRQLRRAAEERRRLRDEPLVVAEELGDDRAAAT